MATLTTPDGPVATTQGGTIWVKTYGDFSRFVWGGECVYIGDITDERGGLSVTTRADAREGGLRRDGVLVDPPGTVSTTLSMKRIRGDKLKTTLRNCFWLIDKRTQCKDFDDPLAWTEIERVYRAKVGTRTTTPGTSIMDSNAEDMVNFDLTALESVDIYRMHIEEDSPTIGSTVYLFNCIDLCHGERCVGCGDDETDAVFVAGGNDDGEVGSPYIIINEDNGDPDAWTNTLEISDWDGNNVDGITCLGEWGAAVSNGQGEVLYTRDRFTTYEHYQPTGMDTNGPNDIDAASQSLIVIAADNGYIYRSRDGLVTCPAVSEGTVVTDNLTGVEITPSNRQIIYVWSSADDVILKTENAGETWFQIATTGTTGGITAFKVHPDNPNLVLAGTDNGEIYQSTDGGETWTEQEDLPGLSSKADATINDIDTRFGGVWFAAVTQGGVGTTWERIYINYEDGATGAWEYYNPLDGETYVTSEAVTALAAAGPNRCAAVGGNNSDAALVALLS